MKRALVLLLSLCVFACASNDGFIDNDVQECGPGSPVMIDVGWDRSSFAETNLSSRVTMLVRVANNSDEDIVVKTVRVDPMTADRDQMIEIERGSQTFEKTIAEGEDSTFEIPMMARWRQQSRGRTGVMASGLDVIVGVDLASEETYRCRFRLPL